MARKVLQIILLVVIVIPLVIGQTVQRPILVEKDVKTEVTIKQVDKDELQRILEAHAEKINDLEGRVSFLEGRISELEGR